MSSFFEDLKLLHPNLKLPSSSESSAWKEKLVDSTISPDEWSAHAKKFLMEIGGEDYHSLLAENGPATHDHDGVFGSAITAYVSRAQFILISNISNPHCYLLYLDVEGRHRNPCLLFPQKL